MLMRSPARESSLPGLTVVRLAFSRRFVTYTIALAATAAFLGLSFVNLWFLIGLAVALAFAVIGTHDLFQSHHSLLRNYPISARIRFLLEEMRPEIRQYFLESDTDGTPFNRVK